MNHIYLTTLGDTTRWLPAPGIENSLVKYGAFEVKAGEVVSMGKLIIADNKFTHITDIEKVKEELLTSDKPELAEKVKVGQFYNRGSILLRENNGQVKLIPVEAVEHHRKKVMNEVIKSIKSDSK